MWLKHSKLNEHETKLLNMNLEQYTEYMLTTYKDIFGDYHKPMSETCMCWGFDINKGWYHVLDTLASKLKVIYDMTGILCRFDQVKEKFVGARFYYHTEFPPKPAIDNKTLNVWDDIISDLVSMYEEYCDYIDDKTGCNRKPDRKDK